jgi:monomeric isocitrate dehydrogenase
LPTLPDNFLTLPKNDAVKTLLMTKVRSDEIYRDCAARHKALADWIMEDEVSP